MPNPSRDTTTLLAIDDTALPLRRNLCLYLTKPRVRKEAVLLPRRGDADAPDNCAAHFYGGVVYDGGKYRLWYYACHYNDAITANHPTLAPGLGALTEGPTCYAESSDGLTFTRPELGQVEWRGSRKNNIVRLGDIHTEGVHVIKDERDPDPARRYKMVYNYWPKGGQFWTIRTATSADGVVWTDGAELPINAFLEQSSLYEFGGMYYVNGQMSGRSEGGHARGRQAWAVVSPDFVNWMPEQAESFLLPDPADPAARGNDKPGDQVHIGVGATSLGNVLVGLYSIWHNKPYPTPEDWFGYGTTSGDFGLVVSNDGLHFREPVKGHVWMHRNDSPPTVPAGLKHERILCQGNGILNVGDETRIYHSRWVNTSSLVDYHAEIALATLPRDRWGALGLFPDASEGSAWSSPLLVPANARLGVNIEGGAGLSVDVADERFSVLPEWSGENGGRVREPNGFACDASWPGRTLGELTGRTVRLRVHLRQTGESLPRLFALYLHRWP